VTTAAAAPERYVRRFGKADRTLHGLLMLSFLGLSLTGMPLLFSHTRWAGRLVWFMGGFAVAGFLHRTFAVLLIGVFLTHLGRLLRRFIVHKDRSIFWGPTSLMPQPRDLTDIVQHVAWFFGRGPRPSFERYTYWEKFDYWGVFWGMAIIGSSGLMLWFPEFFSRRIPGSILNVAFLVHGEEALLAVGFIFTIHLFNGHLRPEKFPMDLVIFTGRLTETELRHERPGEYARLAASGELERLLAPPPTASAIRNGFLIGTAAVVTGLLLVVLIVYALI
jgi:cytochrome b subunit of formate dehydrogenase